MSSQVSRRKNINDKVLNAAYSRYRFRLLDKSGWNFRHPHYHEEGRRTLYKAFGIKFLIIVNGIAIGKENEADNARMLTEIRFKLAEKGIDTFAVNILG